jgi:hypothetical protein
MLKCPSTHKKIQNNFFPTRAKKKLRKLPLPPPTHTHTRKLDKHTKLKKHTPNQNTNLTEVLKKKKKKKTKNYKQNRDKTRNPLCPQQTEKTNTNQLRTLQKSHTNKNWRRSSACFCNR